jgi:hypothetical protein
MSNAILDKCSPGWKEAIEFLEAELTQVNKRQKQLNSAISTFNANLKRGVPWPGEEKATGESATQH